MQQDFHTQRPLFGGAITSSFPLRFQDVSNIRQVPDHQEVFVDPSRDESLIFELLDYKHEVGDNGSATWFLQDLANEQDAEGCTQFEQSEVVETPGFHYRNIPSVISTAVGQMSVLPQSIWLVHVDTNLNDRLESSESNISKGRQGREAQNIVRVYLANIRLKGVDTDVLVTAYEPVLINPLSESATTVGAGMAVPAAQSGCLAMSEVFKLAVSTFKVIDWNLFSSVSA